MFAKIILITAFLYFVIINFCFSQVVNIDSAKIFANNFYLSQNKDVKKAIIVDEYTFNNSNNVPLISIFNFSTEGFVIISRQKNTYPILGYSLFNSFNNDNTNKNFNYWLNQYKIQINNAIIENKKTNSTIKQAWSKLYFINNEKSKSVAPLLTSQWNQDKYYNSQCPSDAGGPDGHAYTGCVATAIGQIMNYYRWPINGVGSYSYIHPVYGNINADFQSSTYDFNAMVNKLTFYEPEVAKLLFHIGVSVDMDYGPNGSGMWNHHAAYCLKTFFKYCQQTRYIFRDSTTLNWDSLVISNLDNKKPLYYAGWEDTTFTSGHAFVCDGYQSNTFFHFNWGWGGSNDGYFYLDQLNPAGANFNLLQELVVDIYPDTINYTYPNYCTINNVYNTLNGTFTDGSSNNNYQNNSNCNWLILPDCGSKIKLQFDEFNISNGDSVIVYDGTNENAPVIENFNSSNPPVISLDANPTNVNSTSNKMFVKFLSDSLIEEAGFKASYFVNYCFLDTIYDLNGVISDGSGPCDYNNNSSCRWVIKPNNAGSIVLNFTEFNLDTNAVDYLRIFKNNFTPSNSVAVLNMANPPTSPIVINAPIACLRFITNTNNTASGWSLNYDTYPTEINNNLYNNQFISIFPNPITKQSVINIFSVTEKYAEINIFELNGKLITSNNFFLVNGSNSFNFSDFNNTLKKGCYIIKIKTEKDCVYKKVIVVTDLNY